jgi:hypothetical protein
MLAVLILSMALASEPQNLREQALTCELLSSIRSRVEAEIADDPPEFFFGARAYAVRYENTSFSDFVADLQLSCPETGCRGNFREWERELATLPFRVIRQSHENASLGGNVPCADDGDPFWRNSSVIRSEYRARLLEREVSGRLPPNHPDHMPPVDQSTCGDRGDDIPQLVSIEITRPVFHENGRRAFLIEGHQPAIYVRQRSGRWVRLAVRPSWPC